MSLYVFDTDTFSLYRRGNAGIVQRLQAVSPGEAVVTIITVEEALSGWYKELRRAKSDAETAAIYQRLAATVRLLARFPILDLTEAALLRYKDLRSLRLNVGLMDLRIAAIALEEGATVVTRNVRDFGRVPDLAIEDWTT